MTTKAFDLNIEEVLEDWEIHHALREVIANALDEQMLTGTAEIEIRKDKDGSWHIRDFGRGLQIAHFTLNENPEKLNASVPVIGKFGVGLKDALATFNRRNVEVLIQSPFGTFRLRREPKHGFSDIVTLHVEYDDVKPNMVGTEFVLKGVSDSDIANAKSLFLKFSGESPLDTTPYGQILARKPDFARVYILGVFAAEEPNFLFSYNITSLTESMRKKLNREKLNVGRTTYADRVKTILRSSTADSVHDALIDQVTRRATGEQCDEMSWIEVSQMALTLMDQRGSVAYVTEAELQTRSGVADSAKSDGYQVIVVTEQQKAKLEAQALAGGPRVRTMDAYVREFNESFQFKFVDPKNLTAQERTIHIRTPAILGLVGLAGRSAPEVRISETMRITSDDTGGVWDPSLGSIVIKRDRLASLSLYAGTLLHEAAHFATGTPDVSRAFELALTNYLGTVAASALGR